MRDRLTGAVLFDGGPWSAIGVAGSFVSVIFLVIGFHFDLLAGRSRAGAVGYVPTAAIP